MNKLLLDEARREQSSGPKQAAPAERLELSIEDLARYREVFNVLEQLAEQEGAEGAWTVPLAKLRQ